MDAGDCPPLTGATLLYTAFGLALANFIVVLDTSIANVSVSHIAGSLAVSPTQGTWAITSYAVADAISVPLTGWLAMRFGTVRWFLVSIIGFGVFSFLCGLSGTLSALIVFRILQGLSGGPLMPLTQTLLLRIFPKEKAATALTIWAMTTTAAPIFGPILGGYISDDWSWPWIFFINLPLVGFVFFVARGLQGCYETPISKRAIDLVGLGLLVLAVGAFQIMLDTGRDNDWFQSTWIVALAIIAAIGFAVFLIWEWTAADPIVALRIFRNRGFAAGTASISIGYAAFFSSLVLTPLWLQTVVGYTATQAGLTVAWVGVGAVVLSPVAAQLVGKLDVRLTITFGILWMAAVSLMRAGWTGDASYWTYAFPQMLQGVGMPFFFIGLTTLAMSSVDPADTASAAGLMSFVRTLSGAVGTAIATTMWESDSRIARADAASSLNDAAGAMTLLQRAGLTLEQARGRSNGWSTGRARRSASSMSTVSRRWSSSCRRRWYGSRRGPHASRPAVAGTDVPRAGGDRSGHFGGGGRAYPAQRNGVAARRDRR